MCDHTNPTQRILRTIEDWLLVAHPDTLHDLDRHLVDAGSNQTAVDIVNLLGHLATEKTSERP